MPTVHMTNKATNLNILNNIRANASSDYQDRIPEATRENIREVGNAILGSGYQPVMNTLMSELVNRISFVFMVQKNTFENPLRGLKKGMVEYGMDIEEIYVGYVKAKNFDPERAETEVFKRQYPDVKALYHRMNRQDQYKVTISREQLAQAFVSDSGLSGLISQMTETLYKSDEWDEFILMKQLLADFYSKNKFYPVVLDAYPETQEEAENAIIKIRSMVNRLPFISTKYNAAKVPMHSNRDELYLFINPEFDALTDVKVLAKAFNMSKADFLGRVTIIDDFGSAEGMENVVAILADRDWFMVWDKLYETGSIYNPEGLYWNNTLNHWQVLSTSDFMNAVVFLAKPTITSVTVTPATATIAPGAQYQFTAEVGGDGSNNVIWSTSSTNADTIISEQGLLIVAKNETATSITVTATSFFNSTKTGTATVTVPQPNKASEEPEPGPEPGPEPEPEA